MEAVKRSESRDYPAVIPAYRHLAWVLDKQAEPGQAAEYRAEALALADKHGAYGAWPLQQSLYDLADILRNQGKFAEAEPLLAEALAHAQQDPASNPTLQREALQRAARFYEAWDQAAPDAGKGAPAAAWRKQLEDLPGPAR